MHSVETTRKIGDDPRGPRDPAHWVRAATRFIWQVVVPLVATAALLRFAYPSETESQGTWAEKLARTTSDHPLALGVGVFLVLSVVCRYWGPYVLEAARHPRPAGSESRIGLIASVALAALAAFGFRTTFGIFRVDSASMLPTLVPGDLILGKRFGGPLPGRSGAPQLNRGEVIVFDRPSEVQGPSRLIKRVIGLPGDRIRMNGPHPVINDWEVPSCDAGPYFLPVYHGGVTGRVQVEFLGDRAYLALYTPNAEAWNSTFVVPPGEVFVLGDDRNNSSDSRAWNHGKGGGLRLGATEARVERWLLGERRDEHLDFERVSEPLDLSLRLAGLDTSVQADAIRQCLNTRPKVTNPPRPHEP